MAIRTVELMHKCSLKHLHIGTARMTYNKETKEGKQSTKNMKTSEMGI